MPKTERTRSSTRPVSMGKRELILAEAIRLFNRQGFFDTRLEDIAEAFGVGKTSISYHFKNKQLLLSEAYSRAIEFYEQLLDAAEYDGKAGEQYERLVIGYIDAHRASLSGQGFPLATMSDFSGLIDADKESLGQRFDDIVQRVASILRRGRLDHSISVKSIEATTFFTFNLLHWIPRWLDEISERHHESAIAGLLEIIRHGLNTGSQTRPDQVLRRPTMTIAPAIFDRETRNQMKREAILRTGIRHLNRNGYRNLSLDDISAELGVTRGALYYQIPDKEHFLIASFDRTFEMIERAMDANGQDESRPAIYGLGDVLSTLFEAHISEHDPLLRLNLLPLLEPGPRRVIVSRSNRITSQFSELIGRGQIDGSIRNIDCEGCEHLLIGTLFAASARRFAVTQLDRARPAGLEPVFSPDSYFEVLFDGLKPRDSSNT